ncbi:Cys-tRNA(Pro)/Cys-tRNA(Cys) deacylase YbaK [Paenibacillus auburnensis]|uniref:Cys-tRNA(Pro)/Cys-tRNA(Cys) deacylase n=1 Tax=Paenibacillus auburnensis TaxID=2905649 RepID=A0ABM9BT82_9BACL|nr:Cys-tRNA(Pro) deacylase [Paenibacillus auburnensis]CAH1193058.1 Cys-tRNA(Pro)/Cys-tRNA(Cys) deacylase YbaK [Paenibacillus auburnensis]
MQISKTNALRMLDAKGISYEIHLYDNEDGAVHGTAVAEKIGKAPETVFKTLVSHSGQNLYVFVIPVAEELDLKKAAKAAREKKIEMLPMKDLLKWTGYVRGGCSPVGMKKLYPTFIEHSAEILDTMAVSAGKIGMQMELVPQELADMTGAVFCELIK